MREEAVNRDRDLEIGPTPRVAGHSGSPRSGALQRVVLNAETLAIGDVEPRSAILHLDDVVSHHAMHRSGLVAPRPLASPAIPLDDSCRPAAVQSVLIDRICLLCGLGRDPRVQHRHGWLQRPDHASDADDMGDGSGALPRPVSLPRTMPGAASPGRSGKTGHCPMPCETTKPGTMAGLSGSSMASARRGESHPPCRRHPRQCHPVKPTVAWRFELPRTAP